MSEMQIIHGSSFVEDIGAVYTEISQFGIDDDSTIVLLEGTDDAQVMLSYFYHNEEIMPFRLVLAEEFEENSAGKKNALDSYEKYKNDFDKLFCVLDRDYDFLLDKNKNDQNILYYDYYELENHLFELPILRLLFTKIYNCKNEVLFKKLVEELSVFKDTLQIIAQLSYFRELHYHGKSSLKLTQEQITRVSDLCKPKYHEIFLTKIPEYKDLSFKMRLEKYIEDELQLAGVNLEDIKSETNIITEKDFYEFLERYISGKQVISVFMLIIQRHSSIPIENVMKEKLVDVLKNEWIPNKSKKFSEILCRLKESS